MGCYRLLCPRKHGEECLHHSLHCSCKNAQARLSKQCYCRSARLAWLIALNPRLLSEEFGLFFWEFCSCSLICCLHTANLYLRYLSFWCFKDGNLTKHSRPHPAAWVSLHPVLAAHTTAVLPTAAESL